MSPSDRLKTFGFAFDPFEHLDSTRDPQLIDFVVVPPGVEIAWSEAPIAIFSLPGGGKSTLRRYTEYVYRQRRGREFPVSYIADRYEPNRDTHHAEQLLKACSQAFFMYLLSYPDIFFEFNGQNQRKSRMLIEEIPFDPTFLIQLIAGSTNLIDVAAPIGAPPFSGIIQLGEIHRRLVDHLFTIPNNGERFKTIESIFTFIKETVGARSIHFLIDGLDNFPETIESENLLNWILPLLRRVEAFAQQDAYLKFFLPMDIVEAAKLESISGFMTAMLEWDNYSLAEVIRRRVYVASEAAFDSLDAISAPDLRNVELQIAQQLPRDRKLPRQMILRTQEILQIANRSELKTIQNAHLWL